MKIVNVTAGYALGAPVEETTLTLIESEDGRHKVLHGDRMLGYVWKGSRTYSRPTHKGSRIAKYHKQVPEWHGGELRYSPIYRHDTRAEVLRDLIAKACADHAEWPAGVEVGYDEP